MVATSGVPATESETGLTGPVRIRGSWTAFVVVLIVVVVVLVATGCSTALVDAPRGTVTTVVTAPVQGGVADQAPAPEPAPEPDQPEPAATDAFDRIAAALPAGSGLAVAPVGRPDLLRTAGDISTDVAWSTIKVPLAIAALRVSPDLAGVAEQAITVSDNAAAETLWAALGGEPGASAAVEGVMAQAGGDGLTRVPTSRLRPGFSIFGQTRWALGDQALFAAGVACMPDADAVLGMMARIDPSQQWGLGRVPGALFKGGWGPGAGGTGYLVRQFGVIDTAGGRAGVAIATYAADMGSGAMQLSEIADRVAAEAGSLHGGQCR
ncbi:hypothetical protein [Dietzia alimentaria]|uniref:hypothetical protein n=1 Tax=Dietzia alimentaria TaxID=665550 RepID=UPI00114571BA|nr:hypothetical protein [Dietzia alimentaria]